MSTPRLRLGQLLVDARLITEEDLEEVLALQRTLQGAEGKRLGALLVERGLINETQLTQILSHQLSVPWVSLLHIEFSRQLLNLVPHNVAERFCLVPIYVRHVRHQGETLYVAMDDPSNEDGLRACREHSGLPVRAMIAPPSDIQNAIRVYYGVKSAAPPRVAPELVETESPPARSKPASPTSVEGMEQVPRSAVVAKGEAEAEAEDRTTMMGIGGELTSALVDLPDAESRPTLPEIPMSVRHEPAPGEVEAEAAAQGEGEALRRGSTSDPPAIEVEDEATFIEVTTPPSWRGGATPAERLRGILGTGSGPPPSTREVEKIPRPRGRAPRMVALTLLDGTTISLPAAKKRKRAAMESEAEATPASAPAPKSEPAPKTQPVPEPASKPALGAEALAEGAEAAEPSSVPSRKGEVEIGLTARDLVLALRAAAHGADASEVLGNNVRWEAMFAALLSLMLKKHLIADWEFVDELKNMM